MELEITADTTALSYWLNWRVLLCSIWVFTPMVGALLMICKYEDLEYLKYLKSRRGETQRDVDKDFCGDEAWRPCLKVIHPLWLLAYRVTAFFLRLAILVAKVVVSGGGIYYYYTHSCLTLTSGHYIQFVTRFICSIRISILWLWSGRIFKMDFHLRHFLYVINTSFQVSHDVFLYVIFFMILPTSGCDVFWIWTGGLLPCLPFILGLDLFQSIYGSFLYNKTRRMGMGVQHVGSDAENGTYVLLEHEENGLNNQEENYVLPLAVKCSYVFQAIFQMNAGAVMLTDCIYWFIIFPFLTINYNLSLLTVTMHSVNAVLLLGDAMLNCLQVPFVRISLFVLWTGAFVIFQWIIHACVSIWWPYPFLDLSSPYAPVWYLMMGLMHIPCYALFALIVGSKRHLLSKWFPLSCQC